MTQEQIKYIGHTIKAIQLNDRVVYIIDNGTITYQTIEQAKRFIEYLLK